jgi:hypothetical protein
MAGNFVAAKTSTLLNPLRTAFTGKLFAALCALVFVITGCSKTDVTRDPNYGDFLAIVGIWKTKVPLKLYKYNEEYYLTTENGRFADFFHIADIPTGTKIRIDRLILDNTSEAGEFYRPMGIFPSGPYAGDVFYLPSELFAPNCFLHNYNSSTEPSTPLPKTWVPNPEKLSDQVGS